MSPSRREPHVAATTIVAARRTAGRRPNLSRPTAFQPERNPLRNDPRDQLLNRNIRLFLGAAGLLSSSLFGGYAVLMNLFILRLGFGPGFVGLVNGVGLLCWAVAAPLAGARANRFGYRRLMVFGLGSVFVGTSLLPFGADLSGDSRAVWIVASYSVAAAGAGIFFVNFSPFIMGAVAPRMRNCAFALASATFPTAGFTGSLIGAMTFLGILRPFGEGSVRTFFNIYMDSGLSVDTATIGITFALSQVLVGPIALLSPVISGRIGTSRTVLFATTATAICLIPIALIADPVAAVVGLITILAFNSLTHPALTLWQMDLVRPEFWGLMSGFGNLSWALGSSGTALIGGTLIANFGYPNLFLTGAALSAIGALLFGLFLIVHHPTPGRSCRRPAR